MNNKELQITATKVRKGIVEAVHSAKSGHPGGSLSAADMFTYLYFEEMNIDPKDPKKADRDRFVLSKGHTAPGLYSTLANRGYFPVEDLKTLRKLGSYLQGHPCMTETPGVDMSTGSLGQGVSTAVGMALAAKLSGLLHFVVLLDELVQFCDIETDQRIVLLGPLKHREHPLQLVNVNLHEEVVIDGYTEEPLTMLDAPLHSLLPLLAICLMAIGSEEQHVWVVALIVTQITKQGHRLAESLHLIVASRHVR